ncbi:energy-coupling factor transporter transmembrane component T [Orrella sp. 11846]|uniref:energy-coupling factor transporter transmembrane component T n=1 Tax=Orrella sp. 11846 TaxID=3409913 RepID=UPI003B5987A3
MANSHNLTQGSGLTAVAIFLQNRRAGLKLSVLALLSAVLLGIQAVWLTSAALVLAVTVWLLLGPVPKTDVQSRPWLWFGLMLLMLGVYHVWTVGWESAYITLARLVALVLLALIVMRTTPVTQMMAFVEWLLQPLGRLGWVQPAKMALLFGLTLRFLPVLHQQWEEIVQAQSARGLQSHPIALLVPMLARTLQRAQEISQTLDARSFGE